MESYTKIIWWSGAVYGGSIFDQVLHSPITIGVPQCIIPDMKNVFKDLLVSMEN